MNSNSQTKLFEQTVNELRGLPDDYLEEVYHFIKYLKYKANKNIDWKTGFKEAVEKMKELSSRKNITTKDIQEAIETIRAEK